MNKRELVDLAIKNYNDDFKGFNSIDERDSFIFALKKFYPWIAKNVWGVAPISKVFCKILDYERMR